MSIKIENLIKITTSGSYLYLTHQEYAELTGQVPSPVALKDINWNGPIPELAKDQRIAELEAEVKEWQRVSMEKDQLLAWADKNMSDDNHNFKIVRDKQREEIEKLRCEVAEIGKQYVEENEDNFELLMDLKEADDYIEELKKKIEKLRDEVKGLTADKATCNEMLAAREDMISGLRTELEAMTLKAKGMVEKKVWRDFPEIEETWTSRAIPGFPGRIISPYPTDHGTAEVLAELLAEDDIEPVEPLPAPEPEPIPEVTPEPETVPEPVFNDTAVTAEEATEKYPAKKTKGRQAKDPFTAEQEEKYRGMIQAGIRQKDIAAAMVEDTGIKPSVASSRYYVMLKSTSEPDSVRGPINLRKRGKPSVMTSELRNKYAAMINNGISVNDVVKAIMEDTGISENYARKYYTSLKHKADSIEAIKAMDIRTKIIPQNPVTVITSAAKPAKLTKTVCAELEALPDYSSIKEFKNACCDNAILKNYNIIDLKGQYKASRQNLTW